MYPGLKFFAEALEPLYPPGPGLYRTVSTYQYGDRLQCQPKLNELYVVCQDGSIQSVYEPDTPIGWELIESGNEYFYRMTQVGFTPKKCLVRYHSRDPEPPMGNAPVGSVVRCYSSEAAIHEQEDAGETEVTSQLKKIATIDPLLAHCAVILDDPVQTAAMAKFAEGKMSYVEMRGLCG